MIGPLLFGLAFAAMLLTGWRMRRATPLQWTLELRADPAGVWMTLDTGDGSTLRIKAKVVGERWERAWP